MHKDLCSDRYKSSFEHSLGVKFNEYDAGICEIELEIKEGHLNIGGTTHGASSAHFSILHFLAL